MKIPTTKYKNYDRDENGTPIHRSKAWSRNNEKNDPKYSRRKNKQRIKK